MTLIQRENLVMDSDFLAARLRNVSDVKLETLKLLVGRIVNSFVSHCSNLRILTAESSKASKFVTSNEKLKIRLID